MNDFVKFSKIPRFSREIVITEKIDGINAQILISPTNKADKNALMSLPMDVGICPIEEPIQIVYNIYAGSRSRWLTPVNDNHGFAKWVGENVYHLIALLGVGRFYGEWWGNGIQRGYGLKEKRFSLFNPDFEFKSDPGAVGYSLVSTVPVLYRGDFNTVQINTILDELAFTGSHASRGFMKPEGIVIYHTASGHLYKKTLLNDEKGKDSDNTSN